MRHNVFRYIIAVILIGIGVLLVLENFGVGTFNAKNMWILLYPFIFIVYGLKTMIDYFRYRGGSWMFGSFLLIFGILLMLDRFGMIEFVFKDIFKLWPLLIVYLGFAFIRPKRRFHYSAGGRKGKRGYYYGPYDYTKHYDDEYYKQYYKNYAKDKAEQYKKYYKDKYNRDIVYDATDENDASDVNDENVHNEDTASAGDEADAEENRKSDPHKSEKHKSKSNHSSRRKGKSYSKGSFFSIGDFEYSQDNWKVEPMNLSNLAGDFYLDFTKAFIPEKEIPISISALAGDVRILMPENIEFRVAAEVKAGDINILGDTVDGINRSLFFETDNYHEATRKLDLTLKLKAGSVRIDNV